jgi:hypothetical protein
VCPGDRTCTAGACVGSPHFVECAAAGGNGTCKKQCAAQGLACAQACEDPFTHEANMAGTTFENASCTPEVGVVSGIAGCAEAFPLGTVAATCCCQ